ncbi:MAG: putative portal protein [Prokaryotic dsDNA virus sp.]|mgnify:CR=1 FL=1|nr:MAG: putative portal protein [Prokaryotic dsDNA virus sp.]QDP59860.1 MAG: putative portal protein [Prokaryotic dsDNA virus sp.]|tara:strand:+ start:6867 stop:8762 length:1896 start_codon:yes stop_codon:yes gene_type:complete
MDKYDASIPEGAEVTQIAGYSPSDKDRKTLKYLNKMFKASEKARAHKVKRWRRNEELYNGDFFKPFKLPKYKSRVIANVVHSTIETIYSIMTDRFPKVDIMPKRRDQIQDAMSSQEAVESEMEKYNCKRSVRAMKRDGLLYGNGFIKTTINDGHIHYSVPDVYTVFVDPLATSIDNAKCVTFASPTYIKDIRNDFPNGKFVKPEGNMDAFKSFIRNPETDGTVGQVSTATHSSVPAGEVRTDYIEKTPLVESEEYDYGDGQALLKETWYWEDGELWLATWCDKVLLQRTKSPYPFIPVAMFKNYADEHHFWGKGEPEIIEPLAVGTSVLLSQGVDNLIYHGNPAWVVAKGVVKDSAMRPSDKPGQVFYTDNPSQSIQRLPAGNISSSTIPLADSLLKMTDQVSGVHDITQGRNPSGVTSGRAISQLQEASQQIIRTKEREVGSDTMIVVYKQTLTLIKNNYEQNIDVRKFNESGAGYEFYELNPTDVDDDMDYKYVPGSALPESKASRFDQALDLVQLGLLDQKQFWMWTQKDMSKEILDAMLEQEKKQKEEAERLVEILNTSTDPQEIQQAQLMLREMMGQQQSPEEQAQQQNQQEQKAQMEQQEQQARQQAQEGSQSGRRKPQRFNITR